MRTRTARSGGMAVRWAYGVFLTLCVALAVLVHHETSVTAVSPMRGAAHAVHATESGTSHSHHALASSTYSADAGGCAMPGMQNCTTASVDSVQLAPPGRSAFDTSADLRQAAVGRAPGATVGRSPPDLSVLSQLRL
ncbi:hypothetical protein [Streptomyces canus]|uniref:hypothetical protein n=1 Tax=Streptomyces canus TaxID=58343 RepID=UPI002E35C797|nr:hypothetical protein [Streptomyces canus]